jgi:hypothetical protein
MNGDCCTFVLYWPGPAGFQDRNLRLAWVELRGLEPLTPCLQSDVFVCCDGADLARQLSVSSREIPLLTSGNGTLMARRSCSAGALAAA